MAKQTYPALAQRHHKELLALNGDGSGAEHLSTPRTDEDIAKLRNASVQHIFEDESPEVRFDELSAHGAFTCDDCALVRACGHAFDPYNTRGECLFDK